MIIQFYYLASLYRLLWPIRQMLIHQLQHKIRRISSICILHFQEEQELILIIFLKIMYLMLMVNKWKVKSSFYKTFVIKLLQILSHQQTQMNNSPDTQMPSDGNIVKIPIQLQEMDLMENSSDASGVNFSMKKAGSHLRLDPLHNRPIPSLPPSSSIVFKQPASNIELLTYSNIGLVKHNSSSSLNETSNAASPTRFGRKKIKPGYQLASFPKALQYLQTQSYSKKVINPNDGEEEFEPLPACGDNMDLKQYGLGVYLYFQFMKRLIVALFLMSVVLIFPLILQYRGTGLSDYTKTASFTMTLARFTLGNLQNGDRESYMIVTFADVITLLIMIIFYLHWRSFHKSAIQEMQRDHKILNPTSYTVSVQYFCDSTTNMKTLEQQLRAYIDGLYKGAYEVEIVYNYNGNFDRFIEYDKQIEAVEKEHQIARQTGKESAKIVEQETKLNKIEEEIKHIAQAFEPIYAIIHFRTLRAKLAFINHCKRFKLMKTTSLAIQRALCCTPLPPEKFLFLKKFPIMIRNNKLSRPEEINWRNIDLSTFSIALRWFFSLLLVFLAIIITSAMIGFCTLYVASTSSCSNVTLPDTNIYTSYSAQIAIVSTQGETAKYCYCNSNIDVLYSNSDVNTFCSSVTTMILITNLLQVAASIVSSITNVILSILITTISQKLLRPNTIPKEYIFIFWGVLISNYINSAILPLALNANIFGVQFISYLKFINFMDFSRMSIFSDFTSDWYALISPYYVNMMIIAAFFSPLIGLAVFAIKSCFKQWRVRRMCESREVEEPIIQKEVNESIADIQFDYASETAQVMLYLFIAFMYSGLIPLLIPILTMGLMIAFFCKKVIITKYSVKIPADETLSQTTLTFIPFIILVHGLFSVWSHTTDGIFLSSAPLVKFSMTIFNSTLDRIFSDIIILGEPALVLLVILLDFTIFNFIGFLIDCCKDELEMPVQWAAVQNAQFSQRLNKANILGSYKLVNNPKYGHALKAYNELIFREKKNRDDQSVNQINPEQFS